MPGSSGTSPRRWPSAPRAIRESGDLAAARQLRIRACRAAGVTTPRVEPAGASLDERLGTLARLLALVREVSAA